MSGGRVRVFVTSCETCEGAWRGQEQKLKRFHALSDGRHEIVDAPEAADIILIGNVREEDGGRKIFANEMLKRWPEKCFSLSDQDHPVVVNRGIYASARKSIWNFGRVRGGSYSAYPDTFQNPFVVAHSVSEADCRRKCHLFSFIGRNSHASRERIFRMAFRRADIRVEDSSTFDLWLGNREDDGHLASQRSYYEILLDSKFSLCPRGAGTNSLRLFESMRLGIAPIIVSDEWIFPKGPKWNDISIVVKEKHLGSIESIVEGFEADYPQMGRSARAAYDEFFSDAAYFNYVVSCCQDISSRQWIPERCFLQLGPLARAMKTRFRAVKQRLCL